MSNTTNPSRSSGSRRRRRSRGGRNRSRSGGSQNQNQNQNRGGNRSPKQGRSEDYRPTGPRPPRNAPPVQPLNWWQKLLKAIGLYKQPEATARGSQKPRPATKSNTRPAKSNTRNARSEPDGDKPASSSKRSRSRSSKPRGGDGSSVESSRVYVGNLSYDVSEQDLQELFKGIGGVRNVEIVYNRNTHRSKGYGFVEMLHKDEAVRAVEVLHDQPFMGRKMIVSGAKSKGQDAREDQEAEDEQPQKPIELAPLPEEKATPAAETPAATEPKIETVVEQAAEAPAPAAEAASKPAAETADDLVAKYGFDEPKKDQDA